MYLKHKDLRTAASQLLALAALDLFPSTEILSTSLTDMGFVCEFIFKHPFDDHALTLLEERMSLHLKKGESIQPIEMMRENAAELFRHKKQPLLADWIQSQPSNIVSCVKIGEFYGFCSVSKQLNSKELGVCKLLSKEKKFVLLEDDEEVEVHKITGICCQDNRELRKFVKQLQVAQKNDHQILGPRLGLFAHLDSSEEGCWSWLEKGVIVKEKLENWWKSQAKSQGFSIVSTLKWTDSEEDMILKLHKDLFRLKQPKLRDLPLKTAEISEVYNPYTQDLVGLLRSRSFMKDRAFCFCEPKDSLKELKSSLQFLEKSIKIFGIEYRWHLVSKKPDGPVKKGSWNQGVDLLVEALKLCGLDYEIDTDEEGTGGPRVEARFIDSLSREWGGPSLEILVSDDQDLYFEGSDHKRERPSIIAWSLFGSLERMVALLIEKSGGHLPLWITTEQAEVVPLKEC